MKKLIVVLLCMSLTVSCYAKSLFMGIGCGFLAVVCYTQSKNENGSVNSNLQTARVLFDSSQFNAAMAGGYLEDYYFTNNYSYYQTALNYASLSDAEMVASDSYYKKSIEARGKEGIYAGAFYTLAFASVYFTIDYFISKSKNPALSAIGGFDKIKLAYKF